MKFSIQLPEWDLLKFGKILLRIGGAHPEYNTFGCLIRLLIPISIGVILIILSTMNVAQPTKSLIDFAGKFEAFFDIGQFFLKTVILRYYREEFKIMFEECGKFWKIEEFKNTPIKHELEKLMNVSMLIYKIMVILFVSTYLGYFVQSELLLITYIPNKFYLNYGTIYAIEIVFEFFCMSIIAGYDATFTGICIRIIVQLKMIQYILENLTFSEYDETSRLMKKCIVHHQKLLRFIRKMKNVNSVLLMSQIAMSTFVLSIELCIFVESVEKYNNQAFKCILCIFLMFYQIGLYCFPAAEVTAQAEKISQVIYNSKWYEMSEPFKKDIMIIVTRSQQAISFSPGGVGVITRETFTAVLKTAFSIVTMVRTLKGND